ncbi:MAG: PaaX domain protein [Candidatus Gottesmanbacteria bacterium GW2011_GWC2_39_8]|uniref:PaaX domain protein n=1 Tax=Candidatus Gottesmanbacteria bacterium GW2011_GWC2_39_8 TaxID=1618450 RepID=A0A0G0Q104_9BACT|nr:MAG: PaaX domain protein [Candidatus Gottesmanbacteria bacterium GW2011_GWC2_39_8]
MSRELAVIRETTEGICGSLIDLFLWNIALVGASVGKTGPAGVYEAFTEADEILKNVNHRTMISAWKTLTKKSLLTYKKRTGLYYPEITKLGQLRLEKSFPFYIKTRPWDQKIYLITYDIPENDRKKRDSFRYFLRQIGCKIFQESVFITPYNPRELIHEFVKTHSIPGTIIVSDIGKDGGIGEISLQDLLVQIYSLDKLNEKYEDFISSYRNKNKNIKFLIFQYLSILKDDPQLPFELLPQGWSGDKAYSNYEKLREEYTLSFSRSRNR